MSWFDAVVEREMEAFDDYEIHQLIKNTTGLEGVDIPYETLQAFRELYYRPIDERKT